MKVTCKTGRLSVEVEGQNQKEVFKGLAVFEEVFSEQKCGNCNSEDVKFVVRTVMSGNKKFDFYEVQCKKCFCRLSFGQHTEGNTLFPKRKDEDGKPIPNHGWVKFVPEEEDKKK